ncbi:Hypothetical protein KVN_LOCUS485 [uncultured virus]|nr:Hypothetical protein KVN_LOCUS485 [uncultured virus]
MNISIDQFNKYSIKCAKFIKNYKLIDKKFYQNKFKIIDKIFQIILKSDVLFNLEIKENNINISNEDLLIINFLKEILQRNKLQNFFEKNGLQHFDKISFALENNNNKFVLLWYFNNKYLIHDNYEWKKYLSRKIGDSSLLNLLHNNPFVSIEFELMIGSKNLKKLIIKKDNIFINIFSESSSNININKIMHICKFMLDLSHNKNQVINLNIFFSNIKKEFHFGMKNKSLGPSNINSGSTLSGSYINIWRSEELDKVLIHELIHYLNFDFKYNSKGCEIIEDYITKFNINGEIKLNEAFTETLALIIHSIYLSYKISKSINYFDNIINYEINFSLFQCYKILNYFDININNFFINNSKTIIQTTDVFSYFIIKTFIILSLDQFLKFIDKDIYFNERYLEFIELVNNSLNEKNNFMKLIEKFNKIYINKKNFIWKTLRMTCLQLNSFE